MTSFSRLFQGFSLCFTLASAGFASDALADRKAFAMEYDFHIGGFSIAEIGFTGSVGPMGYDADSVIQTRGILELFISGRVTAGAEGYRHTKGHLSPDRYNNRFQSNSDSRAVKIAYVGERAAVSITPSEPPKPYDTSPENHPSTLDPVTAAVTMMVPKSRDDLCNRTIPVFDGKRRYDIILLPSYQRPTGDKAPAPDWDRPLTQCFGVYERIAGFESNLQTEQRYFPFDIWFEAGRGSIHRIVRLAGKTKLGYAIGTLRQ